MRGETISKTINGTCAFVSSSRSSRYKFQSCEFAYFRRCFFTYLYIEKYISINMYTYIDKYIYIERERERENCIYIYIYVYIHVYYILYDLVCI